MAVGSKLAQIINEKGLTQKEVAERAGIKPQTLNKIIVRDSARADIQIFIKICRALDVDLEIFADDALEEFYKDHPSVQREEPPQLTYRQNRIVKLFSELTESQQDNIIGRAEAMIEENKAGKEITYNARAVAYGGANTDTEISASDLQKAQAIIRKLLDEQKNGK